MMSPVTVPQSGFQKFAAFLDGKKTYMLAVFAILYIATAEWLTGEPPQQGVVDGLLVGSLFTIRLGIKKAGG